MRQLLLVALAILSIPAAAAQGPSATLQFGDVPPPTVESTESTKVVPLRLNLVLSNILCPMPAAFRAELSGTATLPAENATGNASAKIAPATPIVTFDVPAGAYGSMGNTPAGGPYRGSKEVSFVVLADGLANTTLVDVHLAATVPAYAGTACRASGPIPKADAAHDFQVAFNATDPLSPPAGPELPVPAGLVFAAIAAAVVTWRRRARA